MTVIDANILLYAYDTSAILHEKARAWLFHLLSGESPVGLPWKSIAAFLRVMTNPHLPGKRFSSEEVLIFVGSWILQPNVRMLVPGEDHWRLLQAAIVDGHVRGPMITDAQLVALTLEHGGILHTTDRDFARFPGLRWTNPLV